MYGSKQAQETHHTPACLASYAQASPYLAPSPQAPYDAQEAPYEAQNGTQARTSPSKDEAHQAQAPFASSGDASQAYLASSKGASASAECHTARAFWLLLGGA